MSERRHDGRRPGGDEDAAAAAARIGWEHPASAPPLTFVALRTQNASRKIRWHGEADEWSGADWSNAMCGEAVLGGEQVGVDDDVGEFLGERGQQLLDAFPERLP